MGILKKTFTAIAIVAVVAVAVFSYRVWQHLQPVDNPLPLPASLVALTGDKGQGMLMEADAKADYGPLSSAYESQELTTFCGVASGVIVLKSLGYTATQDSYFDAVPDSFRERFKVMLHGMTMHDFVAYLDDHDVVASPHHADEFTLGAFREAVQRNLGDADDYLVVNYQREVLGQPRVGHFSPVGAYDEEADAVLIMDTASYKYPPTWVPVDELYAAMKTVDGSSGDMRGYIEISRQ